MTGKILIVDDNEDVLLALNLLLEPYVEKIKVTTSPEKIGYFMDTYFPDVILLDMNFSRDASSGQEGLDWLAKILQKDPQAVVLFITAYADTEKAVKAIRAGAVDFIPKPWEKEKLLATLASAIRLRQSRCEVVNLKQQLTTLSASETPLNIIGNSLLIYGVWGLPALGLTGAGISTLTSRIFMFVAFAILFFRKQSYRRYLVGYHRTTYNTGD